MVKVPRVSTKGTESNTAAEMGWINAIYKLSGGDFTKRNDVVSQPINEVFTWLIYENKRAYDEALYYKSMK